MADDNADEIPTVPQRMLSRVTGGMRWEDLPPSQNVEDRRGWTPAQHHAVRPQVVPQAPLPPRTPGDLPSQAGLDDLNAMGRRRR